MTPTDQITVPKQTWDALREALEKSLQSMVQVVQFRETGRGRPPEQTCTDAIAEASAALTAANAVTSEYSEQSQAQWDATNDACEVLATVMHFIPPSEPDLMRDVSVLCHNLRTCANPQATEPAANWATYPEKCPITRRDFFMVIEHPELGMAPTYGGPYDSYTIPHMGGKPDQQMHDRELMCHRFDHDLGYWVDDEIIPLRVIHDDFLPEDDSSKASEPVVKDSLTVPAGYKLVPVEPTREMLYAIQNDCDIMPQRGRRVWATMLSAAPEAKL